MTWAKVALSLWPLLRWLLERFARRLKEEGAAEARAIARKESIHDIEVANAARDRVRVELDRHPASLRDDDGFRRDD